MRNPSLVWGLVVALIVSLAFAADDDLAAGIRQLREGDFETAVVTLDAAVVRLAEDPAHRQDLAQGYLHLGIALVALDQREAARARFREALGVDAGLRLDPARHSPKVMAAFEAARREFEAARPRTGGRKAVLVLAGVGAAGVAVALAAKGGGSADTGRVTAGAARFGTPVVTCPNGSEDVPIAFSILVDVTNGSASTVRITSVSSTVVIASSTFASEVGFASSRASVASTDTVAAGISATLRIDSTLLCGNGAGDAPRVNEWSGRVTLATSAGVLTAGVADLLHVNIP